MEYTLEHVFERLESLDARLPDGCEVGVALPAGAIAGLADYAGLRNWPVHRQDLGDYRTYGDFQGMMYGFPVFQIHSDHQDRWFPIFLVRSEREYSTDEFRNRDLLIAPNDPLLWRVSTFPVRDSQGSPDLSSPALLSRTSIRIAPMADPTMEGHTSTSPGDVVWRVRNGGGIERVGSSGNLSREPMGPSAEIEAFLASLRVKN